MAALVLAELFYKFHSFTLESVAFLCTWAALSWAQDKLTGLFSAPKPAPAFPDKKE